MIIGYNILGYDSILTQRLIIQKRKFNSAVFYGNVVLDNLHSQNRELSKQEIEVIDTEEKQLWSELHTNYLSNFEDKLSSGNIRSEDAPITKWRLKRKRNDENVFTTLKTLDKEITTFPDWTAANNVNYEYAIHAVSGDVEGVGAFGVSQLNFWGWILTNGVNNYKFDIQLDSGTINNNTDIKIYDNYTKYPTVNFGNRDYGQGTLTTMPLTYNGQDYVAELSTLNNLKQFINDKKVKLLKNTKGEIFWVVTYGFNHTYMENYSGEPFTVSFNWIEVGDGQDPFGGGDL